MVSDSNSLYSEQYHRGMRYLAVRLLIILLGLGLVTLYGVSLELAFLGSTTRFVYGLLAAYLAFAVGSMLFFKVRKRRRDFMRWQIVVDFLFQSTLVWTTGGVLSIFSPLLFVTLAAATSLTSARGSIILATLATTVLTAAMIAYALGSTQVIAGNSDWLFEKGRPTFLIAYLLASVLGLYAISVLGSLLSHGLRSMEGIQSEILENMAEGLIALDRDGRVVHLNKELRRLFDLAPVPRDGKLKIEEALPGDRFDELRQALGRGERRRFETISLDLEGKEKPIEVKVSSVRDHRGEPRYQIGLISDVTLKREVEAAERRIQKLEDLQIMAMGIAHEIRNPLASIRGCVQEIARLAQGEPRQKRFMEIVCRESDRLDRIIEDFLLYARSGPADLVPLDFIEVIEEAILLIKNRPEFGSRELRWSPPAERPRIFGDRNRLIQLFLNLGINAIEATQPEKGRITVALRHKRFAPVDRRNAEGKMRVGVELEFGDNGAGIEESDLKKMFTPFFTTKPSGSGLGMCIVERIVREHQGSLQVASTEGEGTSLRIWLPVLTGAAPQIPDSRAPIDAEAESELVCHG